jgi:hypothetical protein
MIHSVNIPSRISSVGKKLLFTDILRIEMEHTRLMLKDYISKKSRLYIKNPIKRLYNLLISYEEFERMNVAIEVTSILDNCNSMVGSMIIIDTYPEIGVKQRDIINYIKNNRETLEVDEMDVESIRQNIQIGKARLIVSKFEEMMLPYRNQLSANMITQLTSDKNLYQLLHDILNNSILPVYMNIRDTIDIPINEINKREQNIFSSSLKTKTETEFKMKLKKNDVTFEYCRKHPFHLTLSLFLSLSHTHTHTHSHSSTLNLTHIQTLSLSLPHADTHSLSHRGSFLISFPNKVRSWYAESFEVGFHPFNYQL